MSNGEIYVCLNILMYIYIYINRYLFFNLFFFSDFVKARTPGHPQLSADASSCAHAATGERPVAQCGSAFCVLRESGRCVPCRDFWQGTYVLFNDCLLFLLYIILFLLFFYYCTVSYCYVLLYIIIVLIYYCMLWLLLCLLFFLFGLSDNWIFDSKDEELFLLHQNKSRGIFITRICVPGTRIHCGVHNSLSHTKVFLFIPALSGYLNHLVLYAIGGIQIDYGIWQNLKSKLIVDG